MDSFVLNLLLQALVVGETTSSGVGESVSSATAALMGQVPPPHFCSTVVRLIVLQILAIGVSMGHSNVYLHVGGYEIHTEFWYENLKGRNNLITLGAGRKRT